MNRWETFSDEEIKLLWHGIDTAYWNPNEVTRDLLDEMIRRGVIDPEATYVQRLLVGKVAA